MSSIRFFRLETRFETVFIKHPLVPRACCDASELGQSGDSSPTDGLFWWPTLYRMIAIIKQVVRNVFPLD